MDPMQFLSSDPYSADDVTRGVFGDPYSTDDVTRGVLGDPYSTDDVTRGVFGDPYSTDNVTRGMFLGGDPYFTDTTLISDFYAEADDAVRGLVYNLDHALLTPSTFSDFGDSFLPAEVRERRVVEVVEVDRCFGQKDDALAPSSAEDYTRNLCGICQQGSEKWDLWQSCRHLFCQDCSSEMLSRDMSCPLCRSSSDTVLRGKCYELNTESAGLESLFTEGAHIAFDFGAGDGERKPATKKRRRHIRRADKGWRSEQRAQEGKFFFDQSRPQHVRKGKQQRASRGGAKAYQRHS